MKKIIDFIKKYYPIIFIVSFALIFSLPFLFYYVNGHDTNFHAATILSLFKTMKNGNILYPRVIPFVANNFGYATPIFYAPLSHSISAYLLAGLAIFKVFNVYSVMKIMHFITLTLSGIFMYLFIKRINNNKNIALVSSLVYMSFPYRLCEIYVRDAFAESISFVFIPLIFWGLYELIYKKEYKRFYILFISGCSGLILVHNITAFYCCLFIILYFIVHLNKILNKDILKRILISGIFILGITAMYFMPLVEQKLSNTINIFRNFSSASGVANYALYPASYLPIIGSKSSDGIQFNFLIITLILLIISTFKILREIKNNKNYFMYGLMGLLALFCATNLFPWEKVPGMFLYIQFPWRLLIFAIFFVAIISSYCLTFIKSNKIQTILTVIICFILILTSALSLNKERLITNDKLNPETLKDVGIGAINDYLPYNTAQNIDYFNNRDNEVKVLKGEAIINNLYIQTPYIEFEVTNNKNKESILELPLLYYKGYEVLSENPSSINIYENKNGFIELKIKGNNVVVLNYTGTKVMKLSLIISLCFFSLFIIFCLKRWKI